MAAVPDDQLTAAARASHLRASHADREHVVGLLKAAFVQGRVTYDEFDVRVGQAFWARTYGELAVLTADLPVEATAGQLPASPVRPPASHAVRARGCVAIALVLMMVATSAPHGPAFLLFAPLSGTALLLAAAQLLAGQQDKQASRSS